MQRILILLTLLLLVSPAKAADGITEYHSGVEISWKIPEDELIQLAKVKRFDRYAITRVIKNELQKYPKGYLGSIIEKIYLSRSATVQGARVGGLAKGGETGGIIYLTSWNDSKVELARRLHHEVAHHVMYASPAAKDALGEWKKLLPEGVKYYGNGLEAIKDGVIDHKITEKLYKQGFITPYAATAIEEDFAETMAGIFGGEKKFWKIADKYPLIGEKAELVSKTFMSIDPQYTVKYMRYRF